MRAARTLPLILLVSTFTGCDSLSSACRGVGFGEQACAEPTQPMAGPWLANATLGADTCGLDTASFESGWLVQAAPDGFTLLDPSGAAHACAVDGDTFTCALPGEQAPTLTGTTLSRSTATAQLSVTGAGCQGQVALELRAAWRDGAAGSGGDAPGGDCPRSYDRYTGDGLGDPVALTVDNQSDVDLGLYGLSNGGAVYYTFVSAHTSFDSQVALGAWMVLATDYDVDACVHLFQVTQAGQVEVWRGQ